ncbi:MAG: hypothetical protein ACRDEA_21830, partial [Microcystaceae cyanobacterium]
MDADKLFAMLKNLEDERFDVKITFSSKEDPRKFVKDIGLEKFVEFMHKTAITFYVVSNGTRYPIERTLINESTNS